MLKIVDCCRKLSRVSRCIHTTQTLSRDHRYGKESEDTTKTKNAKRKVKETVELITLLDTNNKTMGLKPKKDALNLAKKLNLSLEKTDDHSYGKSYPAYKLTAHSDVFDKNEIKSSSSKVLKKLPINSRISDNDLDIKIKTIKKWLAKNCEVHIAITSRTDSSATREVVQKKIEEHLKAEVRFLNIRNKEDALKFIIIRQKDNSPISKEDKKLKTLPDS